MRKPIPFVSRLPPDTIVTDGSSKHLGQTVMAFPLPEFIETETALDEVLARPSPALVAFARSLRGPLLILGAGGKMGPSLAVLAARAIADAGRSTEVLAVSRYSDASTRHWLEARNIRTITCDLLAPGALSTLPDAPDVIYMVGRKFGTREDPEATWVTNTVLPAMVADRYRLARTVALSTGNVYPLAPASGPGSCEADGLAPLGEYAASCVARERVFGYFARRDQSPIALVRLSYALDLRYGVLLDIANQVYQGRPIDVRMGYVNCIWQGDANDMILRSLTLAAAPARAINLTGDTRLSVRDLAHRFGEAFGRPARIAGTETETAYLSDMSATAAVLGAPQTPIDTIVRWTAHWVKDGGRQLGIPTHFDVRNGDF